MKKWCVKISIISLLAVLIILGAVFLQVYPQRDPQLVGGWELDGVHTSTLWLYADGRGRIEPEVSAIAWRTRGGQLIIESMGVERDYEYSVSDGIKLILTRADPHGTIRSRTYMRVSE